MNLFNFRIIMALMCRYAIQEVAMKKEMLRIKLDIYAITFLLWNVNTKLNILNKGVILHILNFSFKVLPKDVVA